MVLVEDAAMSLIELTNSSYMKQGAHILYMFEETDKYFQNAISFISEGIEKGHLVLFAESQTFYDSIIHELKETKGFTDEQLKLIVFIEHENFYYNEKFDAAKVTANLEQLFHDQLSNYDTIRAWGHVLVPETSIGELIQYESNCDKFFEGKNIIAVCSYNTLTTTAFLQNELMKFHNFFMVDEKIIPSPLYNHKYFVEIAPGQKERLEKITQEYETLKKQHEKLLIENKFRKDKEEYLRLAKQNAENANHMKNIFLSQISHDLRTPLNSILGYTQILLELNEKDPRNNRMLTNIHKSSYHLLDLIDELLDFSAIGAGNIRVDVKPINVQSFLQDCVNTMSKIDNPNVEIIVDRMATDLFLQADEMRLKQIIHNLLVNAVKYNHPDGTITISVEQEEAVKINVKDTGIGLPEHEMDKLFEPFYRSDRNMRKWKGTGLGLAIVANLTEKMNGKYGACNNEEDGATFWVEFPQTLSNALSLEKENLSHTAKKEVLYIEDEPDNIFLMKEMLRTLDYINLECETTGRSGMEKAIESMPDLILLDLGLPDMNGKQVLEQLKITEVTKRIPIVVVSADTNELTKEEIMNAGCAEYVTKPINLKELRNTMAKYLM